MKLEVIKLVTDAVVSTSVGMIVGNAIKATTPANLSVVRRVGLIIGGTVISSMVGDHGGKYVTDKIDETVTEYKKMRTGKYIVPEEDSDGEKEKNTEGE